MAPPSPAARGSRFPALFTTVFNLLIRPFPYAPEVPFPIAIFVYSFFVVGALLYATVRKKKPAAMAVIMVILETIAFFCVLVALSHAGG